MFKRGVLTLGSHNLSFSHSKEDIDKLLDTYQVVLPMVKKRIKQQDLLENIQGDILKPLFKVR
jgi:glutamate-1-semialdehyde 2,1-aminomutase